MNNNPSKLEKVALMHAQKIYSDKYNVRFANKIEDFAGFDIIVETYKTNTPVKLIQVKAIKNKISYIEINELINNKKIKFWSANQLYELWLINIFDEGIIILNYENMKFLKKI